MKILLCQDIKGFGWLGDVVEVAAGYARNYLLPQHLAVVATEENVRALAKDKTMRAKQRLHERGRLEAAAAAVEGAEAVIAAVANEQGHLFGSVTPSDIAANLAEQGFEVAEGIVELAEHIKQVGNYPVELKFAEDLTATVNVVVVPMGEDITSLEESGQKEQGQSDKEKDGNEESL